ncbi:MAG TPA: hypothetical protein PKC45_19615 [Gemmatales bacterium]|nr:hypothetical protein [Gemmatales bacterium]
MLSFVERCQSVLAGVILALLIASVVLVPQNRALADESGGPQAVRCLKHYQCTTSVCIGYLSSVCVPPQGQSEGCNNFNETLCGDCKCGLVVVIEGENQYSACRCVVPLL